MPAGYSANPLYKKLGLKPGFKIKLINEPGDYRKLIGDFIQSVVIKNNDKNSLDFIHFFTNSISELEKKLPLLKTQIKKDGIIWVSWYKKSAGKPTELTENTIRDTALAVGLVDIKVCAVDNDWSGLKLVFRVKDR